MTAETPSSYFDTSKEAQSRRGKRSKGSRAKLAQRFFEDTYAAWEEQGPSVLARAAFHDPVAFANMVARLMPQKIEVSTPTDGMSDERLAELLDFAERMAGLKAEQAKVLQGEVIGAALPSPPHKLADENGVPLNGAEAGGGGPLREEGVGGENTSSTLRADPAEASDTTSNALNVLQPEAALNGGEQNRRCTSCGVALQPHEIELCGRCGAPTVLPYPVGRPFPPNDAAVRRENIKALNRAVGALAETEIDPASLF